MADNCLQTDANGGKLVKKLRAKPAVVPTLKDTEFPGNLKLLGERCESGESTFSNAEMSIALRYATLLYSRVAAQQSHYQWIASSTLRDHETMRIAYVRTMKLVAADIQGILDNTEADCS